MLSNKGNSTIPLFKSPKSIERKQIRITNLNRGKRINYKREITKQQNIEVHKNTNANATYLETNNLITTAILLTWYRKFKKKGLNLMLWLAKPPAIWQC